MDLPWMEAILRLAASQSKIKVRVDYVTPDMKLIIYILQQSFQALFCARPDFNNNFLLWRNNKKVHIFWEPWQLTFSALSLPNRWTWAILSLTFKSGEKWFQRVEKFQNSEIWGLNNAITDGREGLTKLTCIYLIYAKFIFHLFLCVEIDLQCDFLNCLPFSLPKLKMPTR